LKSPKISSYTFLMKIMLEKILWDLFKNYPLLILIMVLLSLIIAANQFIVPWQIYCMISQKNFNYSHLFYGISLLLFTETVYLTQSFWLIKVKKKFKRFMAINLINMCQQSQTIPPKPSPSSLLHTPDNICDLIIWIVCHGLTSLLQWSYALCILRSIHPFFIHGYVFIILAMMIITHKKWSRSQPIWDNHAKTHQHSLQVHNHLIAGWKHWPLMPKKSRPWKKIRRSFKKFQQSSLQISLLQFNHQTLVALISCLAHLLCCVFLFNLYQSNAASIAKISMAFLICLQLNQSFHYHCDQWCRIIKNWNELTHILNKIPQIDKHMHSLSHEIFPIDLQKVSLDINDHNLFNRIDLSIEKGTWLRIGGESGAGKTSLSLIISGALNPTNGHLLYNHQKQKHLHECHPAVLYCQSLPFIDHLTLKEFLDENKIKKNQLDHDLQLFPENITLSSLSLGQKQRLYLSKSLAKHYALIILDEALSGISLKDELIWLNNLKKLSSSVVYISHRENIKNKLFNQLIYL
jgi:ABC-type bacteriocin/lantibiotic exporter with double-glycine peptidase domain